MFLTINCCLFLTRICSQIKGLEENSDSDFEEEETRASMVQETRKQPRRTKAPVDYGADGNKPVAEKMKPAPAKNKAATVKKPELAKNKSIEEEYIVTKKISYRQAGASVVCFRSDIAPLYGNSACYAYDTIRNRLAKNIIHNNALLLIN